MKLYFRSVDNRSKIENTYNVSFRRIVPKQLSLHCVLWHLMSWLKGKQFYEYQIVKDGQVVSTAQVVPRIPIFPFMPSDGWHIGPCLTIPSERGKRFYPLLLQHIMDEHPSRRYYMIIDEHNKSSVGGVKHVDFQLFAKGIKDRFGRYVITERTQE